MGQGSRKTGIRTSAGGYRPKLANLTDKQELFIREYCVDLNAAAAGRRVGMTASYANKLMSNPDVVNAIRIQLGKRAQATEIDAEKVLCELALIAFADPAELYDEETGAMLHVKDMPESIRRSIASMDVIAKEDDSGQVTTIAKVRFWNKMEALSAIGKHLGILGNDSPQQHLHLHSQVTNPYLNAPPELILQAKEAMTKLEHSVKGNIDNE